MNIHILPKEFFLNKYNLDSLMNLYLQTVLKLIKNKIFYDKKKKNYTIKIDRVVSLCRVLFGDGGTDRVKLYRQIYTSKQ